MLGEISIKVYGCNEPYQDIAILCDLTVGEKKTQVGIKISDGVLRKILKSGHDLSSIIGEYCGTAINQAYIKYGEENENSSNRQ